MADDKVYYNEFFEGYPKLSKEDLKNWLEEERRKKKTFVEQPSVRNLTKRDIWEDRAKFYFLPFLINCYKFTRWNKLPHFAIMCSPTCMFYRDRLHLRNFMQTIHSTFFRCMEMCIPKKEKIMLLVEKRFHVYNPVDGGSQQLYNMLWDYDLSPIAKSVLLPPPILGSQQSRSSSSLKKRLGASYPSINNQQTIGWDWDDLNPDVPEGGIELCRRTCWLEDDLYFLCQKYNLVDEYTSKEIIDISKYPEEKQPIYEKTARDFYFKVFEPKDDGGGDDDQDSSDSDFDPDDDYFDSDDTVLADLDSTTDFKEDDEEMKKIISFLANMPKVTNLVQGMLDMMGSLNRILPLILDKIDDPKLQDALRKTIEMISAGTNKVLRICAYLGIKVERKPSLAINQIVKNRFKKDKKQEFLDYEIKELNKSLDALEDVDKDPPKKSHGQIPLDIKPSDLYPQKIPIVPKHMEPLPIVIPPDYDKDDKHHHHHHHDKDKEIPSVEPPQQNVPIKGENGVK